ncbi:MAG TPA: hypothetical protein VE988_02975 [Gemmataceae bacterium]|nr:hypothetical protein [Gemmataceae bacterium]
MKRALSALVLAAGVGGCMSSNQSLDSAKVTSQPTIRASGEYIPQKVPGVVGAYGEPIVMAAPYTSAPPTTAYQARQMMSQSVPLDWVQMGNSGVLQASAKMPGMQMPPGGMMAPPGVPFNPSMMPPGGGMMPPPNMQMPGGKMMPAAFAQPPGAVAGLGMMPGAGGMPGGMPGGNYSLGRTQVRFAGPDGMRIAWLTQGQDGKPTYSGSIIEAPGRYNFAQASIYRLKLSGIRGRPGLELYPTLEVVPGNPKTAAFLAHSAVPLEFTPEDFKEVTEGKYLVKVIYLPDPQFQELAATGTDFIISTRLDPGMDPILEAQRRGSILLVIRMGNVDQEAPNTPSLDTGGQGQCNTGMAPPGMMPPGMMPNPGMMAGPMPPANPMAAPAAPPAVRPAPTVPQSGNPVPSMPASPANPGATAPPNQPGPRSAASDPSVFRPASTGQTLPGSSVQTTFPMLPDLPGPTGGAAPVGPAMPPMPAALATQGVR